MIEVASIAKNVKGKTSVVRSPAPSRYIIQLTLSPPVHFILRAVYTIVAILVVYTTVNSRTWRLVLRAILSLAVWVDQSAHAVVRVPVASLSEAALQMRDAGDGLWCQRCYIYTQWHSVANLATIIRYSYTAGNKPQGRDVEEVRPVGFQNEKFWRLSYHL